MIDKSAQNDVMIGFCHNGSVATVFMNSLLGAFSEDASRSQRRLTEYHDASGPYIHDNRARIATYFLDHTDYQWLWMLDNDIQFPRDSLYRLLDECEDRDIKLLAAAYFIKYGVSDVYLSWLLFSNEGIRALPRLPDSDEPVAVTATGMGCTLIHRDVLHDIRSYQRENFPSDPWDTFGSDVLRFDDGKSERMGEDVTFCMRARRHNHLVYGLPSLVVEHFKPAFMPHGQPSNGQIEAPIERTSSAAL